MKQTSFAETFVSLVTTTVAPRHAALRFTAPSSSYTAIHGSTGPAPDLVIENVSTGRTVAAEVKVAEPGRPISFSVLPAIKLMRAAFPDDRIKLVIFTVGEVPPGVRSGLEGENIQLESVQSVEEAVKRLETLVRELE